MARWLNTTQDMIVTGVESGESILLSLSALHWGAYNSERYTSPLYCSEYSGIESLIAGKTLRRCLFETGHRNVRGTD